MKRIFLYSISFLFSLTLYCQDITVSAEYPSVVTSGQQFGVSWTVNSGGGEFEAPSFEGFYKISGPQTSYSSSTRIINGKMSQTATYSHVYYLQAVTEGKFTIPPAKFTLKNKSYFSDPMEIEVVSSQQVQGGKVEPSSDLFLSLALNRKEVFLGEHILATVKIYTRVTLSGINEIKYPSFNSFIKADLQTPPLTSLREENINGTIFGAGTVQQFLLYPQVTGEISIEPVQMSVLVQQKSNQTDPFFGDFFSSYQTVQRVITSDAIKVNVKPLSGIKPDDFSGVVGKLRMEATLNRDSIDINDAVTLKVTISGAGNLKIAAAPKLKLPPDLEVYDPKINDDLVNSASGTTGTKTFEYLLIPRHNGDFSIPAITYSYYDPATGRYEKLTSEVFSLHARKGDEQGRGITVYGGVAKEDVQYLGKDIRFLKPDSGNLRKSDGFILSNSSFYSAYAFAAFAFLLILFFRKERLRRNSDLITVKNRRAGKVAGKRLKAASACLRNNQTDNFYDEILKAIWGYLSDKLNIPLSDLNRSNAISILKQKGITDEKIEKLTHILDTCEYARFAPSASGAQAENIFEDSTLFIKSVENSI